LRATLTGSRAWGKERSEWGDGATLYRRSLSIAPGERQADDEFMTIEWRERIKRVPGVRSGQPIIRGLRITVKDVLGFLASGMTVAEILHDFPELEEADIHAALAYAAENLSDSSAA